MDSVLQLTDKAVQLLLYSKFGETMELTSIDDVLNSPKSVVPRAVAELRGNEELELISFYRSRIGYDKTRARTAVARRGMCIRATDWQKKDAVQVKAVPAIIDYSLVFWSRDLEKVQRTLERYFFWQHEDPNLSVEFKDELGTTYPLEFDLHIGDAVQDESTFAEKFREGQYAVYVAQLTVDTWIPKFEVSPLIKEIIVSTSVTTSQSGTEENELAFKLSIDENGESLIS